MRVEEDFEQFIKLLNEKSVKFCVVGAYAVAFHGYTRATKDMDILVEGSIDNAKKLLSVVKDFFGTDLGLTIQDFIENDNIIQFGYEPNRIDILTNLSELNFNDIWKNKIIGKYGKCDTYFIGLNDLIHAKQSAMRDQDKVDLKYLLKKQWQ